MILSSPFQAVAWEDATPERSGGPIVRLLDQRALPGATIYLDCTQPDEVMEAIRTLTVRGAPAIGVAAAYGIAQAMQLAVHTKDLHSNSFDAIFSETCKRFAATRPTAVNLFWAIKRMQDAAVQWHVRGVHERAAMLVEEAKRIHAEDVAMCHAIGRHGAPLMPDVGGVITHCNTGALATGGHGTALGVIRTAVSNGKKLHVWIDETRPLLQGSRLTAWECAQDGLPATLITDNMAAHVLKLGHVQAAIAGADRIARNGDSANKIGTYGLAILCKYHNIPFYIAAPTSTVDIGCDSGAHIPIEERKSEEVTHLGGQRVAAAGVDVFNPAFDVVPHALIAGIITEHGVATAPFEADLVAMVARARAHHAQVEPV
jgi:methylthioribose-1-phosphate isomerase